MVKHNSNNFDLKTLCFESCQFKKEILHPSGKPDSPICCACPPLEGYKGFAVVNYCKRPATQKMRSKGQSRRVQILKFLFIFLLSNMMHCKHIYSI